MSQKFDKDKVIFIGPFFAENGIPYFEEYKNGERVLDCEKYLSDYGNYIKLRDKKSKKKKKNE